MTHVYSDHLGNEGYFTRLYDEDRKETENLLDAVQGIAKVTSGPEAGKFLVVDLEDCELFPIELQ